MLWSNLGIDTLAPYMIQQKKVFTDMKIITSIENQKLNTTLCWLKLEFTITTATILSWEQLAVDISVSAHFQSQTQETLISFEHSQKLKLEIKQILF
jgi:hypothetical protein